MANATSTIEEVRFDLRDEQITHVYVLSRGSWDAPIGVQGWHYKAFPARIPMVEILTPQHIGDYLLWPLKAPEQHDSYMTINADGALSPETENALAHMGQLVAEQYAEQDKGSAIEEGVDLTELALKEVTAAFARLQSEHSDLIERERELEAQLAAERRRQNIPDMVIDGYVNYVIASKAIRIEAMPFRAWLAAGDR